jgi:iron(III) transport system permease protein
LERQSVGTATAWLVTTCHFPFRRTFEIVLALPLAFPAYVLAYAYTDLLDHPGAVQSALRDITGWGPRDYWFPEIRSLGGAAAMLVFVLYPYVYLLARAAFLKQSPTAYFAARTLGHTPWSAFWRVSLPMARPAIAGGVLLALMETIADFGTVAHFGVQTFATGIYSAWFSMGDRMAASQLALCLLVVALTFALLERAERGAAKRFPAGSRQETMERHPLDGLARRGAFAACAVPVAIGFAIPLAVLFEMAVDRRRLAVFAALSRLCRKHADAGLDHRNVTVAPPSSSAFAPASRRAWPRVSPPPLPASAMQCPAASSRSVCWSPSQRSTT